MPSKPSSDPWLTLMPFGVVTQDEGLQILRFNERALELLGLTEDQLRGRTSFDPRWKALKEDLSPFPGEEHPAVVALKTGHPVLRVVMGVYQPDTDLYRWLQIDSFPAQDDRGAPVVHTYFQDITSWIDQEERFMAQQNLFLEGPVLVLRFRGSPLHLESVTPNFSTILGIDPDPFLGGKEVLWSRVHPEDLVPLRAQFAEVAEHQNSSALSGVLRFRHGRGDWRSLEYRSFFSPPGASRPPVVVAHWIDRTEELRNEQRLALTLEATKTGTWEWSASGKTVQVDAEWYRLLGQTPRPEGVELEEWRSLVHPDDRAEWDRVQTQVFGGELVAFELRIRQKHPHEGWVWFRIRGKAVELDPDQKPLRILGTNEDIHEELLAEEERTILSQVVEQGPSAIIITNLEGRIEYVNAEFTRLSGYSLNEVQGKNPRLLRSPATDPRVYAELWSALVSGRPWHGEFQNLRKDGRPYWVQASISPIRDSLGRITRYAGQQIDVSARKVAEEESQTQNRFQVLLNEISYTLLKTKAEEESRLYQTILKDLADQFRADRVLFGFADRKNQTLKIRCSWQASGIPLPAVVGLGASALWWDALVGEKEVFQVGVPTEVPWSELPVVSVLAAPFLGGQGDPGLLIFEAYHTHWTKESLVPVTVVANTLSAHFQRRHDEHRIRESQRAADRANEAKSLFLAQMSHEIRTPMNGILGLAELALAQEVPLRVRTFLEGILSSGQALLTLVNDVLDLSKIEAGKLELETLPFALGPFLESLLLPQRVLAEKKGLYLEFQGAENLPVVQGDPTRLRQVLTNLVGNALKFTEQGGVTVSVIREKTEASFRFEVQDTGPGVPLGAQSRLFQNFSQGEASVARLHGGTGLGLSISRQLVERMGGDIGYHDALHPPGGLFWFRVALPLGTLSPVQTPPSLSPPQDFHTLRVLVAEDNPVNQQVVSGLLGRHGISAVLVSNGLEVLDQLRSAPFDLVLMDVQMPQLDGLVATKAVRRGEAGPHNQKVPIVALTAQARPEDLEEAREAGMDSYLTKPITADKLAALLEKTSAPLTLPDPEREKRTFDLAEMRTRLQLEDAYLAQVMKLFLQGLPGRRQALAQAMAESNLRELQKVAHTLKGTAANLVATGLSEASARLESLVKEGRTDGLETNLAAVYQELDLLEAALHRFLSSDDGKSAH